MAWLRRVAAAPLLLLALIFTIGAVRLYTGDLARESAGEWITTAFAAAVTLAGAAFLLRPDLRRLRNVTPTQLRDAAYRNPIMQAALAYAIAAVFMFAAPRYQIAPAVLAHGVFSAVSCWTAARQRRWWLYAGLAVVGWCLLFLALVATSEAITVRGFGEGAMLFLGPAELFPALLVASGIFRLVARRRPETDVA